jgi:hypothetical protein
MGVLDGRARRDRDTAELRVADFHRVTRLLDLPVIRSEARRHLAQDRLDLRTSQVPASSAGALREERAYRLDAKRDGLLLRPRFPKRFNVARRPLGGCGRKVVRHIVPIGVDMFEA